MLFPPPIFPPHPPLSPPAGLPSIFDLIFDWIFSEADPEEKFLSFEKNAGDFATAHGIARTALCGRARSMFQGARPRRSRGHATRERWEFPRPSVYRGNWEGHAPPTSRARSSLLLPGFRAPLSRSDDRLRVRRGGGPSVRRVADGPSVAAAAVP